MGEIFHTFFIQNKEKYALEIKSWERTEDSTYRCNEKKSKNTAGTLADVVDQKA